MSSRNHEVVHSQILLDQDGQLVEPGWSRSQVQEYRRRDIKASALRIKEWDYYLILNKEFGIALTISDDGYIGMQSASFLDFKTPAEHTESVINLFPMGKLHMPECSDAGVTRYEDKRLAMKYEVVSGERRISCMFHRFDGDKDLSCSVILKQPKMDTMVIATPWKKKHHFFYNQKINCMSASGWVKYGNQYYEFDPATDFASLDWGRGVWTYDNTWYWSNGNGIVNGKHFGFNIGYGFGDTSKATENIIIYDGIAHKLDEIEFLIPKDDYCKPWKITSSDNRFEMDFMPVIDRHADIDYKLIVSKQHQVFGHMTGKAVLDDGTVLEVKDLFCFAEVVHNKY